MRISFAATNPCHVWDMAVALSDQRALGIYYSGYPRWKLGAEHGFPARSHSLRTVITYALHGRVPERFRPSSRALFRWQDDGFDRWVSRVLEPADFLHGIPGQCLISFRRARQLGIRTVLNHATGPARQVVRILEPEYERMGMAVEVEGGMTADDQKRIVAEMELADYHCCASSVVREQLIAEGVSADRIWVIPYGADPRLWFPVEQGLEKEPEAPFRILFAGQVSLRKGLRFLLEALESFGSESWQLDVMGPLPEETRGDREAYAGKIPVRYHGPVSQRRLADAMRSSDLLVLPSLEEGFGLVVVQSLACGLPCVVSSMVGAKDLIVEGVNGSVFPVGNSAALAGSLEQWSVGRRRVEGSWGWKEPARLLVEASEAALAGRSGPMGVPFQVQRRS